MSKRAFQILLFVALIVCASTVSMSNQVVTDFKIGFMIDKVYFKWKSTIEDNVKEYIVERSHDKFSYNTVGKVKPKGSHSDYMFIDKNIFKTSTRTFYYRSKIINKDNSFTHIKVFQLTPRVSSAKQTWGSIKTIFH